MTKYYVRKEKRKETFSIFIWKFVNKKTYYKYSFENSPWIEFPGLKENDILSSVIWKKVSKEEIALIL